MKQIIFLFLFMLFIPLTFQQYIGFRHPKNNNRIKYIDPGRIRNNPRLIKMRSPHYLHTKENNHLKINKISQNKPIKLGRGPVGQYLHYGRNRINTHEK